MCLNLTDFATSNRIRGGHKLAVDFRFLLLEQLLEIRNTWYWHVIFALILPVAFVFGFGRLGGDPASSRSLLYIVSGSAVFAVANDGLYVMASRIGLMRRDGRLLYYASLPISQTAFVLAQILSRLLITLPGMLVPILFGSWLYDLSFHFSPWILLLLPLTGLSLSAMGMLLGTMVENLEILQMIANLLLFTLVMAAPVFTPMDALPLPLQVVGLVLPPTYAAAALRAILSGTIDAAFYLDLGILGGMTLVGFFAVKRWLRWYVN